MTGRLVALERSLSLRGTLRLRTIGAAATGEVIVVLGATTEGAVMRLF